jgi:allantoin racemase
MNTLVVKNLTKVASLFACCEQYFNLLHTSTRIITYTTHAFCRQFKVESEGIMKIKVINPNTTWSMTQTIGEAARAVSSTDVEIIAVSPDHGPASIEGYYDEAMACLGLLEEIRKGELEGVDAYVIACFGDPGLDAAREITKSPVIGVAEAAMRTACYLATGFSVVTTLTRTVVIAEHLVDKYGVRSHCRRIRASDIAVLELEDPNSNAYKTILEECRRALLEDGSGAIVLGCAGMADLCERLQAELGVPVIDGVAAATVTAESLIRARLMTSKRGDYANPLNKTYKGIVSPWAP